ncbi:hypothetical protein VCSRO141_0629 [Vibrio cholerae]|nr:hypothetical protein DN33_185 [Vibrio cholerae]GIB64790.1 hypothetical protein VCSRO141_0629 [Vibrio cholerae]
MKLNSEQDFEWEDKLAKQAKKWLVFSALSFAFVLLIMS